MDHSLLQATLGWCTILNVLLLLFWFLMIWLCHDWVFRLHTRWFKIKVETFDAIHYAGLAFLKIAIFVFNVVPYLALLIANRNG